MGGKVVIRGTVTASDHVSAREKVAALLTQWEPVLGRYLAEGAEFTVSPGTEVRSMAGEALQVDFEADWMVWYFAGDTVERLRGDSA